MADGNWFPIILFFILLFGVGGVCMLALNMTGIDVNTLQPNQDVNQTFIINGIPTAIIGSTNVSTTGQNTFLGFVFPSSFNFSFINNSQVNFVQSPQEAIPKKSTILGKFILALGLLPDIVLYPILIIESALLIIGIIKLLPFQG